MLSRVLAAFALFALSSSAFADWKPAPSPLMTKWGKKVTPENAWREYPRPQLVRESRGGRNLAWLNLNGLWDYAITAKDAAKPSKWDGKILVPFCVESALSGVGKSVTKDQLLWYRRTLDVPAEWKGKRVLLNFGAVDWEATVFVNGKELGIHKGGSDPFSFDITEALEGANELVVRVWDPTDSGAQPRGKQQMKPEGIWYTPVTGIWQTVWMEPVPTAHITRIRFTPDIDKGEVECLVEAVGGAEKVGVFKAEIVNGARARLGSGKVGESFRFKVPDADLWTPDNPKLYEVAVGVTTPLDTAHPTETVLSYFAMRKITAAKDDKGLLRLMLNNKPQFQMGPLDQGWWPDGLLTPPSEEAMRYDLEVLKKIGFNMLRKHIKVEPARYYYDCDRMGLLVWQDMPSGGVVSRKHLIPPDAKQDAKFADDEKKQFRAELKAMIDHLRCFPSIVVWVPFNEGWGQHDTNDVLSWVKDYDKTRLVNGPSGWADRGYGDMKDMHNYPGPGMFPVMPDRVSVLGEFGGLGLPVKGHLWKDRDNWGYQSFKTEAELRQAYRTLMVRMHPLIGKGLAASVYTQTTDVEVEVNGFMTYDREVIKFDVAETAKWHKALYGPPPEYRELVATSELASQTWRYTTEKPLDKWMMPGTDVTAWKSGDAGFGTKITPNTSVRTEWKTPDIWIRRSFDLTADPKGEVLLRVFHDEDTEIYINGVLAATRKGFVTGYGEVPISAEARKALKVGTNVLAAHCKQTGGGQYIDVGVVEIK